MIEKFGYKDLETMQSRPDLILNWRKSLFEFKGYLGIDEKQKNLTNARNQIIINGIKSYEQIICDFTDTLMKKKVVKMSLKNL
jgi:hypothetical protein